MSLLTWSSHAMTQEEILNKIIEAIDPVEPVTLDTDIKNSADFNSLGMLNLITTFKPLGIKLTMRDLLNVNNVRELVELIASR